MNKKYTIKPDEVIGRLFYTDLKNQKISSINNKIREENDITGMTELRNALFTCKKYETAVINKNGTIVIGHTNSIKELKKLHKKTVEKCLSGYFFKESDMKLPTN